MSAFTKLALLSFVSSAVAAPYHYMPSGYSAGTGAPYGMNTTGPYAPTGSGVPSGYPGTLTSTTTLDVTETLVQTVYMSAVPISSAATVGAQAVSSAAAGQCGPETITVTAQAVTVTVTPGVESSVAVEAVPSSSATHRHGHHHKSSVAAASSAAYTPPAYSPSVVAPASSVAAAYTPPAYSAPPASSASPVVPSAYVPVSSVAAVSSAAPVSSAAVVYSSAAASTPVPSATSTPSTGGTKRGVPYNDASLTTCFENDKSISWAYNWAQTSDGLSSKFEYVPMLIDLRDMFTATWETNWKAALASGTTNFMSFNEPELPAQANLTPDVAATNHIKYMNPVKAAGGRVGAPSITNGDAKQGFGLGWLAKFETACGGKCDYDFVNIHWYDSATNIDYFKSHVTEAHTQTGKPVWLSEFAATGSDDQIVAFLKEVLPWLDSQDFVEKYSYFMASDGKLVSGTTPSTIGAVYASA